MQHQLEALMLVLAVGSAVAVGAKRVGVAYNAALVVVGLLLVFMRVLPALPLDPQVVLLAFLPVLVFEGALFADVEHLASARRAILMLAAPGVVVSLLATAAVAQTALHLPFRVSLLLGALLAITDTVSVLVAFRSVRVPARLSAIMEGESLFNDGTALVLVAVTTELVGGTFHSPLEAVRAFAVASVGGALVGLAVGALGATALRTTPDHLTAILTSLVLVFATSILAEKVHASPVIAVVVAGLMVGRQARRTLGPSRVLALEGFWEAVGFALNVLMFLLVGMQLPGAVLVSEVPAVALAVLALHAGRAVTVYVGFLLLRALGRESVPLRWQHVMVLGNVKGSVSMAAALALPPTLPYRDRIVAIVFGVTFVTMVTQALPFKRALRWLRVGENAAHEEKMERARAELLAARRGQSELNDLLANGLISRRAHAERRADFQLKVVDAEATLRGEAPGGAGAHVERSLLVAQKAAILEAARKGVLGESVAAAKVGEIDEALLALRESEES